MKEQPIQTYQDDEISLLDILVILAESWRLFVFGPLIAGVLAGGLSFLWPKTFESVTIVRMSEQEVALLYSPTVLDPLVEKFGLLAVSDGILDDARQELKKRLTFTVDVKTKLATIVAKERTPEAAHALASSAVTALLKELQVKGIDKELIEKKISLNNRGIESAEDAIESIQRSLKRGQLSDLAQELAIKNLSTISTNITKLGLENLEYQQKLEPKGVEVFVQEPSLPQRKVSPKRSLVVLSAILASAFALLIFVFVRNAWVSATQDLATASKLASIKRSLGLWKV